MSSAFNLSTLAAMQEQRVEQASVHFWQCQLTRDLPRYEWRPDAKNVDSKTSNEAGKYNDLGATKGEEKMEAESQQEEEKEDEDKEEQEEQEDLRRHLLRVTSCVLAPKASGIHLVTVRTCGSGGTQQASNGDEEKGKEPKAAKPPTALSACPIVCIDPASQRTLALSHEFVLETGGYDAATVNQSALADAIHQPYHHLTTPYACIFELAEGDGPVWLTGMHRVHCVRSLIGHGDLDEDEEIEEKEDEEEDQESDGEEAVEEEEEIEEEEEDENDVEEEEEDGEEEVKKGKPAGRNKNGKTDAAAAAKPKKAATKAGKLEKKQPLKQQQQPQRRKRAKPDS